MTLMKAARGASADAGSTPARSTKDRPHALGRSLVSKAGRAGFDSWVRCRTGGRENHHMGKLADAAAKGRPKPERLCRVGRLLTDPELLSDDWTADEQMDLRVLLTEVREGKRTATSVQRSLALIGVMINANQVTHHLRGDCAPNKVGPCVSDSP